MTLSQQKVILVITTEPDIMNICVGAKLMISQRPARVIFARSFHRIGRLKYMYLLWQKDEEM